MGARMGRVLRVSVLALVGLATGAAWGLEKEVSLVTKEAIGALAVAGRLSVDLHGEFMLARTWGQETALNWYNCGYSGGGSHNTVGGNFGDFGLQVPAAQRDAHYPHAVKVDPTQAVRFDGNDRLAGNFPVEPALAGRQQMALEIWLRDEQPTAGEVILGWQSADGRSTSAPVGLPAGCTGSPAWRHLVLNCRGEQETWYLDGQVVYDGARKTVIAEGHRPVLGGASAASPSFRGDLAAVRLHDQALTVEEIAHNRRGGVLLGTDLHNWWRREPDKWWVQESAHFRHCVDKAEMAKWNERQLREFEERVPGMFRLAELIYRTYSERLAMRTSVVSRRPAKRGDGIKYKTPIQPSQGSWMGVDDDFGWACQGAGHINPHELVHGWQAQTGGAVQGNYWEAHANFPQTYNGIYQTAPPTCVARVCWVFPANGRDFYHERLMFEHLAQTPEYGPMFIAKLWYDGATETEKNPYPWLTAQRFDPDPATPFADEYARMVQRNVTWDYLTFEDARGAPGNTGHGNEHVVSAVNRYQQDATAGGNAATIRRYARILLQAVPEAPDWWRVPKDLAPQQLGWNICPLTNSAAPVSATLQGFVSTRRGGDWRLGFVSVDSQGKPTYGPVGKPGETLRFTPGADAKELYLTVVATPTNMLTINMVGDFRSFEQEQFPYQVKLAGCRPLDVMLPTGAPTVAGKAHPNGGGFVDSRATVAETAYVAPQARVLGNSKILGQARILDHAVVQDSTVRDHAVVSGHAEVVGGATIQDWAKVRDYGRVAGMTVKDEAKVLEHAEASKPRDAKAISGRAVLKGGAIAFGNVGGTTMVDGSYCKGNDLTKGKWFTWSWGNGQNAGEIDQDYGGLYLDYAFEEAHDWMAVDSFGATWGYLVGRPQHQLAPDLVAYKSLLMVPEEVVPALEGKRDFADSFVERLSGWLLPPADGDYTFWIAADDEGEFWLGAAGAREADRKLCSNPFYADYRNFTKFPSQKSAPVRLEKGKAYPLLVLHGDGHMGDSLTVAWTRPGGDKPESIGAPYLAVTADGRQPGVLRRVWSGVARCADLVKRPDYPEGRERVRGGALALNGVDQCVELPKDVADFRDLTLALNVKWLGGADQRLLEFANERGDSLSLSPSRGGRCVLELRRGTQTQTLSAPALQPNVWTSLAVVLEGDTGRLYVAGSLAASSDTLTLNPDDLEATRCWLGRGLQGGWFRGLIDSFRIYSLAKRVEELRPS